MKTRALLVVLFASTAAASGFRLETHHARAAGMGIAVTALTDDASSIVYNPAGLAGRKGLDVQAGLSLVIPSIVFTSDASGQSTQTLTRLSTPVNFNASFGITDDLSVGLGVFNPFGAVMRHGPTPGKAVAARCRRTCRRSRSTRPSRTAFTRSSRSARACRSFVAPSPSSAGCRSSTPRERLLAGDAWGLGWNAGVQGTLIEDRLTYGFTWRSNLPLTFQGRAHFGTISPEFQLRLACRHHRERHDARRRHRGNRVPGDVTPPARPRSERRHVELVSSALHRIFTNNELDNPLPKRWRDTMSVHLGGEYDVTKHIQARFGAVYDETATPTDTLTPDLPDAQRVRFCLGVGYRFEFGLNLDAGYQLVLLVPQASTAPGFSGTYSGSAQVVGFNAGYRW